MRTTEELFLEGGTENQAQGCMGDPRCPYLTYILGGLARNAGCTIDKLPTNTLNAMLPHIETCRNQGIDNNGSCSLGRPRPQSEETEQ